MKSDIMQVMNELHRNDNINWRLKSTFLVLIPKVKDLEQSSDFRPISLMSSINKIISKVISSRLKVVLPQIISFQQSAYVQGRQIMDSAMIANECINSAQLHNQNGFLCKIDFQKAYDNVAWSFIDYVLRRMGFGIKWRRWIDAAISHVHFSVLINGSSNGRFKAQRACVKAIHCPLFCF